MRQQSQRAIISSLSTRLGTPRVSNTICDATHAPHRAQRCRENWVLEASNQHCANRIEVVFVEVLVCALGGVEGQHGGLGRGRGGLDLFVGGIFEGVGDFGGFTIAADASAEPGANEEGGDSCEEDEAVGAG